MSEIKTPLVCLEPGQTVTADEDGAIIITAAHTHADILRYVVADVGREEAIAILQAMALDQAEPERRGA